MSEKRGLYLVDPDVFLIFFSVALFLMPWIKFFEPEVRAVSNCTGEFSHIFNSSY